MDAGVARKVVSQRISPNMGDRFGGRSHAGCTKGRDLFLSVYPGDIGHRAFKELTMKQLMNLKEHTLVILLSLGTLTILVLVFLIIVLALIFREPISELLPQILSSLLLRKL